MLLFRYHKTQKRIWSFSYVLELIRWIVRLSKSLSIVILVQFFILFWVERICFCQSINCNVSSELKWELPPIASLMSCRYPCSPATRKARAICPQIDIHIWKINCPVGGQDTLVFLLQTDESSPPLSFFSLCRALNLHTLGILLGWCFECVKQTQIAVISIQESIELFLIS